MVERRSRGRRKWRKGREEEGERAGMWGGGGTDHLKVVSFLDLEASRRLSFRGNLLQK